MKPKNLLYLARLCEVVYEDEPVLRRLFGKGLVKLFEKKEDKDVDTQVAILQSEKMPECLLIVFRGTQEKTDFITDIDARKTRLGKTIYRGKMEDMYVHDGFLEAYEAVRTQIVDHVKTTSNSRIVVAGHSLGGALATLCSHDLSKLFPNRMISCVTYGSPRVGDNVFKADFERTVRGAYRFVNGVDLVTKVPFKRWFGMNWCFAAGFRHVGKEIQVGDEPGKAIFRWFLRIQPTLVQYHFMNNYIKSIEKEYDSGELDFKVSE